MKLIKEFLKKEFNLTPDDCVIFTKNTLATVCTGDTIRFDIDGHEYTYLCTGISKIKKVKPLPTEKSIKVYNDTASGVELPEDPKR